MKDRPKTIGRTPPMGLKLDVGPMMRSLKKAGRAVREFCKQAEIAQQAKQAPMIGEGI